LIPERKREYWLPLLRKAAGAENSQCQFDEDVTRNTSTGLLRTVIGMRFLFNNLCIVYYICKKPWNQFSWREGLKIGKVIRFF
jgi:hypothetical protein